MTRYPAADSVSMPTIAPRFLALLRGLNVGGQNVIGKDDLVRCFEEPGFESVRTYIQSGNVLFRSTETRVAALTRAIEERLSERLSNPVQAVVCLHPCALPGCGRGGPGLLGPGRHPEAQCAVHAPRRHLTARRRTVAHSEAGHRNAGHRARRDFLVDLQTGSDPDDLDEAGRCPRVPARHRPEPPDRLPAA